MGPVKQGDYQFDRASIRRARDAMKLSQAEFAFRLDIPKNTVSRWETGATTPDAESLAAVYSLAQAEGIDMVMFKRRAETVSQVSSAASTGSRTRLVMAWDFQNSPVAPQDLPTYVRSLDWYLQMRYPSIQPYGLHAFGYGYSLSEDELPKYGFTFHPHFGNIDQQLIEVAEPIATRRATKTVFVLGSRDGDYLELIERLKASGVECLLWTPGDASESLCDIFEDRNVLEWEDPEAFEDYVEVAREFAGRKITRSVFGQACAEKVATGNLLHPTELGFSKQNPYGGLLNWLGQTGIISIASGRSSQSDITITVRKLKKRRLFGPIRNH